MNFAAIHVYWYVIPLIIAISLVYSASRHECWKIIFLQAARVCGMFFSVLLITTAILLLINSQV
jgi:hypothetical protein